MYFLLIVSLLFTGSAFAQTLCSRLGIRSTGLAPIESRSPSRRHNRPCKRPQPYRHSRVGIGGSVRVSLGKLWCKSV